ncbi:sensor histidine kinase [Peribacillus asahii]|uniref:histidine kinase n=1 Tax=Peribacillus asahii TaxID=228899 RepID=A0A398B525_9BACI|nr:HAMP domain-containing sensor histidine kinase [Peribacillus asahii]RID82803.1 sensor histidine kinase [Peribacillus asahii]
MDTKLKNYSHSIITKIIVFAIVITCFTGALTAFVHTAILSDGNFEIISEDNYFQSRAYVQEGESLVSNLTQLIGDYKSEKYILKGGSIDEEELRIEVEDLYSDFQLQSKSYNPNLSEEENYKKFKEVYKDEIAQAKGRMIKNDLREFHLLKQNLEVYEGLVYYASNGTNVFTNSTKKEQGQFKTYPSYMVFEDYKREIFPKEVEGNKHLDQVTGQIDELDPETTVIYVAFTEEFLDLKIKEWKEDKVAATNNLYKVVAFLVGLILSFLYLALIIGRKSFDDQEVHFHAVDRLYNDLNLVLCLGMIVFWGALLSKVGFENAYQMSIPITAPIATAGLILILSLVKHFKNRTLIKHTLLYSIFYKLFVFVKNVYASGSVGVKTVLLVIGYPILVVITFFMFPVTIGAAAWFAFKKVKSFQAIQEGVERIKDGDLRHRIDVEGEGEFERLAGNINSITDGLKKSVDSELKSERLKTELITNVSHDIRTPLTSIITYVDLLKKEKDPSKVEEYVEVLDQKSKRLKILIDDLFEAAKASSGDIPVQLEQIDIVSLITQGLGEVNDKIEASDLEFKINYPEDKVYMKADGRLLWRSIENLLSNIFKYALKGSRVYIDIEDTGNEVLLTFKNISAYELNISAEELMERFKRGDESRFSEGSGLGLSIAGSLIELQGGKFSIQVDGDLFKSMICMPKHHNND